MPWSFFSSKKGSFPVDSQEGRETPLTASLAEDRAPSQSAASRSSSSSAPTSFDVRSPERLQRSLSPGLESQPQIVYALVVKGRKTALVEHGKVPGNFLQATMQILPNLDETAEFSSYSYGEYVFHATVERQSGLEFVCMADPRMLRRVSFAFLEKLKESFVERYPLEHTDKALEYEMQTEFRPELQALMEKWSSPDADRLSAMMDKVKDINETLVDSIDKILVREEKIQILVKSSEMLVQSSTSFNRNARSLHRAMWCRNVKTMMCIALVVIIGVGVLLMSLCGITLKHC